MKSSFPPHTHSPMWCSQQVPVRFFRSENEFCCLSVSLCSQLAPRAVFLQKSTSLLQTEALENRYIYWSLKLWSHQRASELNPSYRTCLPRELSFLKLGGVDLVSVGMFSRANLAFQGCSSFPRYQTTFNIFLSVTLFNPPSKTHHFGRFQS